MGFEPEDFHFAQPPIAAIGIQGYGPERAMYEAVLHHTGLHRKDANRWCFSYPLPDSDFDITTLAYPAGSSLRP